MIRRLALLKLLIQNISLLFLNKIFDNIKRFPYLYKEIFFNVHFYLENQIPDDFFYKNLIVYCKRLLD